MATVRETTYDLLRALGLTTIFGNPGSTELPFLQDLPDDFHYVLALHEGVGAGDGRRVRPGHRRDRRTSTCTPPRPGNAMGGLTNAVYSHTPMVVTAGQQVRSTSGRR